jgi:hypothetical protein
MILKLTQSRLTLVMIAACLSSCGGDNGSSSSSSASSSSSGGSTTPPRALTYPSPPAYTVNAAISPLTPTVTGSVSSYSLTPALPAGLTLDSTSGVISGTPTSVTAQASYTVTASNAGGSTSGTVSIVVVNPSTALSIQYPSPRLTFTAGVSSSVQSFAPVSYPMPASNWHVAPALPAGLTLGSSGTISGTPTTAASAASYTVTASTPQGQALGTLTIAVAAAPLLDLGHGGAATIYGFASGRFLSQDNTGRWILWDYSSGQKVTSGISTIFSNEFESDVALPVALAGSTLVIQTAAGFEVRATADGSVESEIAVATAPTWWRLAADGSYLCAGSSTAITAWSPAGAMLFTRSGNYSNAVAFAAPGQLQVALGAAGTSQIETITVPSGASMIGVTFNGQFNTWFADGSAFLSTVGSTAYVYSNASIQQDLASLPALGTNQASLGGQRGWYWTVTSLGTFTLYKVGSAGQPSLTESVNNEGSALAVPTLAANVVGLLSTQASPGSSVTSSQILVINLSAAQPTITTFTPPLGSVLTFAAESSSNWVAGTTSGVLMDGATLGASPVRYFDYGAATSVAASANTIVVATASGRVLYFNGTTQALEGSINAQVQNLALSADGSVLGAESGGGSNDFLASTDNSVTIYSLPAGTPTATFPFTTSSGVVGMTMSASATTLGLLFQQGESCAAQVLSITSGTSLWCATSLGSNIAQLTLSPDGALVALSPPTPNSGASPLPGNSTANIYNVSQNGTLVGAVPGWAEGWLDNSSLLAFTLGDENGPSTWPSWNGIYAPTGQTISKLSNLPIFDYVQPLSSPLFYAASTNTIYSTSADAIYWMSGSPLSVSRTWPGEGTSLSGGVSGANVVFASGDYVLAEPY